MSIIAALGAVEIGLLFGLVALGVFLSFRVINFPDLGAMKANFFLPGDLPTDVNNDGATNFTDLGILKADFFGVPGPSGVPNICTP